MAPPGEGKSGREGRRKWTAAKGERDHPEMTAALGGSGGVNRNEKLREYDKVGWGTRNFAGDFHESSK